MAATGITATRFVQLRAALSARSAAPAPASAAAAWPGRRAATTLAVPPRAVGNDAGSRRSCSVVVVKQPSVGRRGLASGGGEFAVDPRLRLRFSRGGSSSGEHGTFEVTNPATGAVVAEVPDMGRDEAAAAVAAAESALPEWSATPAKRRSALLRDWHDRIVDNADYLAKLMTVEQGKPLAEAHGEVLYGASYLAWFAEEATRIDGSLLQAADASQRVIVMRQPVGVCALVTPWNFPNAMIARKVGAALAAGCTTVIKPAQDTPLSAEAMVALATEAGIPEGVVQLVTCSSATEVGEELVSNPAVRKVSFTGSTAVGKMLEARAAETMKRTSMELGGNAPFIVFEDADLDAALAGAMASKFRNAGQTCVCANRVFVHASLHDAFIERAAAKIASLVVGNGLDDGVTQGPLINRAAVDKVGRLVQSAVADGATAVVGGSPLSSVGDNFYAPTLLTGVTDAMNVAKEEIFGPVMSVLPFDCDDEVIARANDTASGLAAYFYTRNLRRAWRVSERLEYGMVGVNTGMISSEIKPFGGVKDSGHGREGSKLGVEDYLDVKSVTMDVGAP